VVWCGVVCTHTIFRALIFICCLPS